MSKRKLLLADDSVTIQKVVSLTFADEGIEVISTGDGDSAMAKVSELKPDLVMADVNMPGLNGYQICEKIRNDQTISQTPVILLVGSFEPFDENEARRVGADDFMTKPFQSIRQLVNKVSVLINSGKSAGSAPVSAAVAQENGLSDNAVFAPAPLDSPAPAVAQAQMSDQGREDEAVQATHAAPFAYYETSKFESREPIAESAPAIFESEATPVTVADNPAITEAKEEDMPMPHAASILEVDDDILELPIFDDEMDEENEVLASDAPAKIEAVPQPEPEPIREPAAVAPVVKQDMAVAAPVVQQDIAASSPKVSPLHFEEKGSDMEVSPELVEAVSRKVMERLSEKAIKEVAWEVVPQMAEAILKQMAEDKLKG